MNKRAQFFLLAAVIISAVVISLGVTANKATINREPGNFYDFSYEVKRESGSVLDYEIYNNFNDGNNLTLFVELMAEDIRDKNPDSNFLFLYGNNATMYLRNYGSQNAIVDGQEVPGSGLDAISLICIDGNCVNIRDRIGDYNNDIGTTNFPNVGDDITIIVEGYNYTFPVSRHRQVIFIMQKGVNDESFIAVA